MNKIKRIIAKLKWRTAKNIIRKHKIVRFAVFFFKIMLRKISKKKEIKIFGQSENEIGAAYVINLDRRKDRWEQLQKELKFHKTSYNKDLYDFCHRISAVDGKEIDIEKFTSNQIRSSYSLKYQYEIEPTPILLSLIQKNDIMVKLSKEETAIALSHVKAWKKIVDEKRSYTLVLEDDVFFESRFANSVNLIWQELPPKRSDGYKFDILYLSFREVDTGVDKKYYSKNLFRTTRSLWMNSGYVLSYAGAKKLLNELPIQGPVDLWMNHQFKKLEVYQSRTSLIMQRVDLKSDNSYSIAPVLFQASKRSSRSI